MVRIKNFFLRFILRTNIKFLHKKFSFNILKLKYGNSFDPIGIKKTKVLSKKLNYSPKIRFNESSNYRVNFLIPTLDHNIIYGGYVSLLEFIKKIKEIVPVRIIICDDRYLNEKSLFDTLNLFNFPNMNGIEFHNLLKNGELEINTNDRFFAYSAWTSYKAWKLAKYTSENKFIYLCQEDERVFHHNDSYRAIIDYIYSLPQIMIFNTNDLLEYFKKNKIGLFKNVNSGYPVFYFEPPIAQVEKPTLEALQGRKLKKLLFYSRPETHAGRNLFEIGILALRKAIEKGYFNSGWSFYGIGAAKQYNIKLYEGFILEIKPKVEIQEYKKSLKNYDIGLYLMYAPHPGLVGFEMASAGMIVVVNSFDYRDKEYYHNKSKNFVVSEAHPDALAEALKEAIIKASNPYERLKNIYIPKVKNWDEALPDKMIKEVLINVGLKI